MEGLLSGLVGGRSADSSGGGAQASMRWVRARAGDFSGELPGPRSGHTAVVTSAGKLVVFGGLRDKVFLDDIIVLDAANNLWYRPQCSGSVKDGIVGPGPRAFHTAVAVDCHMLLFGGRSGKKRLGDFWMLDTDTWQWADLSSYGEQPPGRDFATSTAVGNGRVVLFGGWDGSKWLSDICILDTMSLEWRQLTVNGGGPAPRCGHTAIMVEKRLLILGGRGGGGPIMGDLWALKGLFDDEKEVAWTNLKIPGSSPAARCGHTSSAIGTLVVIFGGHGTGGWISRYDVYFNDCVVLDRATVQWRKLAISSEPPPPRAYHTMTRVDKRLLLMGGFDGKTTFDDIWWLVSDDDPLAKKAAQREAEQKAAMAPQLEEEHKPAIGTNFIPDDSSMASLRKKMELSEKPPSAAPGVVRSVHGLDDGELVHLGLRILSAQQTNEAATRKISPAKAVEAARLHLTQVDPNHLSMRELSPLLSDYHRLAAYIDLGALTDSHEGDHPAWRFYHVSNVQEIRLADIAELQSEYRQLFEKAFSSR